MATPAAPAPTTTASEAAITFHNEPWTAEGARLLLEIDEGWVGFRNDAAWSWHDHTYSVFIAICRERRWSCNSKAACVAMLTALRTGAISMQLSNATRTSDGHSQWPLTEMRELGAQMRRVVDGKIPTMPWAAQLLVFVETMKLKDVKYSIGDRTVEGFAIRAGKYVPDSILLQIDPNLMNGKTTPKAVTKTSNVMKGNTKKTTPKTVTKTPNVGNGDTTLKKATPMAVTKTPNVGNGNTTHKVVSMVVTNTRSTRSNPMPELEQRSRRATRRQSTLAADPYDSDDEPLMTLMTRRNSCTRTATYVMSIRATKRRRMRSVESDGDSSYHDPVSEDEDVLFGDDGFQPDEDSVPATQEITSQGELLPVQVVSNAQLTASNSQDSASQVRPSLPQDPTKHSRVEGHESQPSATSEAQVSSREDPTAEMILSSENRLAQRRSPLENDPFQQQASPRQDEPVQKRDSPRQDTANHAPSTNGNQSGGTPARQTRSEAGCAWLPSACAALLAA